MFDSAAKGAFERLETRLGVWSAEKGHAIIYSYARGTGLRLQGGEERTVILTLPQTTAIDKVLAGVGVERFTARAPYHFTIEAKVDEGWKKVWEQGEATTVGQLHKINIAEKNLKTTQLRFKCTSVAGAVIGDVTVLDLNGFFND